MLAITQQVATKGHFSFFVLKPKVSELASGAAHPVPIMIRIDRPKSDTAPAVAQSALTAEAQEFLTGLDPKSMSQAFQ